MEAPAANDFSKQVLDVLIQQLGHKPKDAQAMIAQAFSHNPTISTPEALFDEVYRGEAGSW